MARGGGGRERHEARDNPPQEKRLTAMDTQSPSRSFHYSLRTLFAVVRMCLVLMGLVVGVIAVGSAMHVVMKERDRQLEKRMRTFYLLDGTVDIESERGKGLFSDEELEAISMERDRLNKASTLVPIPEPPQQRIDQAVPVMAPAATGPP